MPHQFKVTENVFCGRFEGCLTLRDLVEFRQWILAHHAYRPELSQYTDFTAVTTSEITVKEIRLFAEQAIFTPQAKRAIVTPSLLLWGLSRVYAAHCEHQRKENVGLFRSREAAIVWLGLADDPFATAPATRESAHAPVLAWSTQK